MIHPHPLILIFPSPLPLQHLRAITWSACAKVIRNLALSSLEVRFAFWRASLHTHVALNILDDLPLPPPQKILAELPKAYVSKRG